MIEIQNSNHKILIYDDMERIDRFNDNMDIFVELESGEIYTLTVFTPLNIMYLMKKSKALGEEEQVDYLWLPDMVIIEELTEKCMKRVVKQMVDKNTLQIAGIKAEETKDRVNQMVGGSMDNVIDQINAVNWEKFGRWGIWVDISLKQLLSYQLMTEEQLERSRHGICSIIAHQGDISELTLVTIPILINFVKASVDLNKEWLIKPLICIPFGYNLSDPINKKAYELMYEDIDLWKAYLEGSNEEVRKTSSHLLSQFTLHIDPIIYWLCNALGEKSESENVTILMSILVYLRHTPQSTHVYPQVLSKIEHFLTSTRLLERTAAAIVFFIIQGKQIDSTVKGILTEFVRFYIQEPWNEISILCRNLNTQFSVILEKKSDIPKDTYLKNLLPELTLAEVQKYV